MSDELQTLLSNYDHKCAYCGTPVQRLKDFDISRNASVATIDHITPKSRGGSDFIENKILACLSCNSQKGQRTLAEYIDWLVKRGDRLTIYQRTEKEWNEKERNYLLSVV